MRRSLPAAALLALAVATVAAAGAPKRSSTHSAPPPAADRSAARGDWPDTPAGEIARRWTEAFTRGEPAMREFLAQSVAPEELAKRGLDARLETYRSNHEKYGSLMLVSVDSSGTSGVKVTLAASDFSQLQYSFFTQDRAPWKLLRVYRTETRTAGHGGFGH